MTFLRVVSSHDVADAIARLHVEVTDMTFANINSELVRKPPVRVSSRHVAAFPELIERGMRSLLCLAEFGIREAPKWRLGVRVTSDSCVARLAHPDPPVS